MKILKFLGLQPNFTVGSFELTIIDIAAMTIRRIASNNLVNETFKLVLRISRNLIALYRLNSVKFPKKYFLVDFNYIQRIQPNYKKRTIGIQNRHLDRHPDPTCNFCLDRSHNENLKIVLLVLY